MSVLSPPSTCKRPSGSDWSIFASQVPPEAPIERRCTLLAEWLALEVWHLPLSQVGRWTAPQERSRGHLKPWWQQLSPETCQTRPGLWMWCDVRQGLANRSTQCTKASLTCPVSLNITDTVSALVYFPVVWFSLSQEKDRRSRWHYTLETSFQNKHNCETKRYNSYTQELAPPPHPKLLVVKAKWRC